MNDLQALFTRLEADDLDAGERFDLERRLADPAVRAAWRRHLIDSALLHEDCAAERTLATVGRFHQRPAWLLPLAAVLLVGVVLGLYLLWPAPTGPARLIATRGDATITLPDGSWPLRSDPLVAGTRIATGSDAELRFAYPDGTTVTLAADSEGILTADRRVAVRLGRGRLTAMVARQSTAKPALFATGEAEVTVLGTRFTLSSQDGATRLAVDEGRVRLATGDGAAVVVGPGETGTARSEPVAILFVTGSFAEKP